MGILTWLILGLVVGVLAKFVMPGKDPGGAIVTVLLGVAGAFVGGYIGSYLGLGEITGFNLMSVFISTLGAIVLLALYRIFDKNAVDDEPHEVDDPSIQRRV